MNNKLPWRAEFSLNAKDVVGGFNGQPVEYEVFASTLDELVNYREVLWKAIEIEGLDNTEVLVSVIYEHNGEYHGGDEFVMTTHIRRTKTPSRYIWWGDKKPHIFSIDRVTSYIECN